MPDQATLEALRDLFAVVYPAAIVIACLKALHMGREGFALWRTVLALLAGTVAQIALEAGGGVLNWGQHLAIDLGVLFVITLPPRLYWQAFMGGIVFAQILMHAIWGLSDAFGPVPDMARIHWVLCIILGFGKCLLLVFWAGGDLGKAVVDRLSRLRAERRLAKGQRQHAG